MVVWCGGVLLPAFMSPVFLSPVIMSPLLVYVTNVAMT